MSQPKKKLSFVSLIKIVKRIWEMSEEADPDERPVIQMGRPLEVSPGYVSLPWTFREDVFKKVFVDEAGFTECNDVQRTLDATNTDL